MRLLHTSDWHLGQALHDFDRGYEHARFLAWLLDTLVNERVDALLIAGDVFDGANPSAAAQAMYFEFLANARARLPRLGIVVIAGNHDSPARIDAPGPVLKALGAHVVGQVRRRIDAPADIDVETLLVPLTDAAGEVAAWCVAMPFLRPGDVPRQAHGAPADGASGAGVSGAGAAEHAGDVFALGVRALYAQAMTLARARRAPGQALLAMGHCHMSGGAVSELSERRIVIGGAEALPADVFEDALAYVALGHLHKPQHVGGRAHVRYSGSPLPLSFAEVEYPHQVLRIDLDGERVAAIEAVRVPRFVDLLRVPAAPAPVDEVLAALAALELPDGPIEAQPYLQVRVLASGPLPGLRQRVDDALAGKPVRLARIEVVHASAGQAGAALPAAQSLDDLAALEPEEVFRACHRARFGGEPAQDLLDAFRRVADAAAQAEAS